MKTKVFNKGQVVIPSTFRKKYGIEIGKKIEILDDKNGIKIAVLKKQVRIEKLQGIFSNYVKAGVLTKKKIEKATESGFTKGYK